MPDQGFLGDKTISRGNSYASLFKKQSCFLRVGNWRVKIFSNLHFKCYQTRGRGLNSWNGYQKLCIRVRLSQRKIILGSTSVWALIFSSMNSTEFNIEHENTCPYPCHKGSSINNISGMYLHVTVLEQLFYNFLYKIHHT